MDKIEILKLMRKIFDILTNYDLSSLKGEQDIDYILLTIYYKIVEEIEEITYNIPKDYKD